MKRNQKIFSLLLILALAVALAGCGSSKSYSSAAAPTYATAQSNSYYVAGGGSVSAAADEYYEYEDMRAESGLGAKTSMNPDAVPMSEKVIYNGNVRLETTQFDAAIERINALITENGGYLESSSVSGSNYSSISKGVTGARSASYTLRVPSENFKVIMGTLPEIGNVPYSETSSRNVTREYYDVQARLDAFKTQEARLLEMLSVAETVEDMLKIQQQLTEVQYEIDSLTGTLRYYDNQVSYSTIYLNVQEVREYTPEPTITLSYRERMVKGFQESLDATKEFFTEFFLWFVTSLPWLIPLILVIVLVFALLRRIFIGGPARRERRAARKAAKQAKKDAKAAEKQRRAQEKKDRKAKKNGPADPAEVSPAVPPEMPAFVAPESAAPKAPETDSDNKDE